MQLSIDIDDVEIRGAILSDIIGEIQLFFKNSQHGILLTIQSLVRNFIKKSPEYLAMQSSGKLYHEIGNPHLAQDVDKIIDVLLSEMSISLTNPVVVSNQISGEIKVNILEGLVTLLNLPEATFQGLPWLSWMLLGGTDPIVIGYRYDPNRGFKASRTNEGIMIPNKGRAGGWGVPPEYAGTFTNNWLTRATNGIDGYIESVFEGYFK